MQHTLWTEMVPRHSNIMNGSSHLLAATLLYGEMWEGYQLRESCCSDEWKASRLVTPDGNSRVTGIKSALDLFDTEYAGTRREMLTANLENDVILDLGLDAIVNMNSKLAAVRNIANALLKFQESDLQKNQTSTLKQKLIPRWQSLGLGFDTSPNGLKFAAKVHIYAI